MSVDPKYTVPNAAGFARHLLAACEEFAERMATVEAAIDERTDALIASGLNTDDAYEAVRAHVLGEHRGVFERASIVVEAFAKAKVA